MLLKCVKLPNEGKEFYISAGVHEIRDLGHEEDDLSRMLIWTRTCIAAGPGKDFNHLVGQTHLKISNSFMDSISVLTTQISLTR